MGALTSVDLGVAMGRKQVKQTSRTSILTRVCAGGLGLTSLLLGGVAASMALAGLGEQAPPAGGIVDQARALGLSWGSLAAAALGILGASLGLGAIARLERRLGRALGAQPDPIPLLEDIDLSQQNLHLSFVGLEKGVGQGVLEMLAPVEEHIQSMHGVANSMSEQAASQSRALEVRMAASEAALAATIGDLRADAERRGEADRGALETRQTELEHALAFRLDEMTTQIAKTIEAALLRSVEDSVSQTVNQSVGQAMTAMEQRIHTAIYEQLAQQVATPALETETNPGEPQVAQDQTYEPQVPVEAEAPRHNLLEPNDARVLAQTGFHRVSSLGLLSSLEDKTTEVDDSGANGSEDAQASETRSGIEFGASTGSTPSAHTVDDQPSLSPSIELAPEVLRLHEDMGESGNA